MSFLHRRKRIRDCVKHTTCALPQRTEVNAVVLGTILPIHRHSGSTETIVVLRGKVVQHYYDEQGNRTVSYELAPNTAQIAMSVSIGQWHALESLEEGTVIFEAKDGAMSHLQKKI